MTHQIVAIDGPAGSGKSSVSKEVARRLHFGYLDTGAAYRALALASLQVPALAVDKLPMANLDQEFKYEISMDPDNYFVKLDSVDVTEQIREPQVAEYVSEVARLPEVREFMKRLTRRLVAKADYPGVVVEGRDITTVVFADAQTRLLLTASEAVRLKRRSSELTPEAVESLIRQVSERDASDSKVVDFMTPAPGVSLVDTSELNFEESVEAVLALIS